MIPNLKAALQESLKQEDEAVKARLQEPAPRAAAAPKASKAGKSTVKRASPAGRRSAAVAAPKTAEKTEPAVKEKAPAATDARRAKATAEPKPAPAEAPKAVKAGRESFSLTKDEAATLKTLRSAAAREGRSPTRSELVRAGIKLLASLRSAELLAAVNALPPVVKKKKKK